MQTMMITLLIDADQGEAILALVQDDAISCVHAYVEHDIEIEKRIITQDRAGSIGRHKGIIRAHSERPLGEALLTDMRKQLNRRITRERAAEIAVEFGMKPRSGPTYLCALAKEGLITETGRRSGVFALVEGG